MKEKGFTLIELLAVIVILAIIALIATPIILGIINDAKKQSNQRSAELYLKAAELAIARENLNGELGDATCKVQKDGNLKCNGKDVKVEIDGTKPASGAEITFSSGKITKLKSFTVGNTKYKLQNGSLKVDDSTEAEEETFTGTIYRYSTDLLYINESIVLHSKNVWCIEGEDKGELYNTCIDESYGYNTQEECEDELSDGDICKPGTITVGLVPGSYETEETKSNITQNFYLKHVVEDNIVQASYVCVEYSEDEEPACIRGGVPSEYGSFDGMTEGMATVSEVTNPKGNIAILNSIRNNFSSSSCTFYDESSYCSFPTFNLNIDENGYVYASHYSDTCEIKDDGSAYCE